MTNIEAGYVVQGYKLPDGWTWERVAEMRAKFQVAEHLVPEVSLHGCCAWGVPMIEGRYLKHHGN